MKEKPRIEDILLDGNHVCLDFINTIHNRKVQTTVDYLSSSDDWSKWLKRQGLLEKEIPTSVPDLNKLRERRELLYRIFTGLIHNDLVLSKDQNTFNQLVHQLNRATSYSFESGALKPSIQVDAQQLNSYFYPILNEGLSLMSSERMKSVKECRNCGWLFLDTSKSGRRRWCNMKTCGNEVKARRHYQKVKEARESEIQSS